MMARNKEKTIMNKRYYKTISLVFCLALSVVFFTQVYGGMSLASAEQPANPNAYQTPALLASGKPMVLKVTVTHVELWNGSAWVTIFSGSSQANLVVEILEVGSVTFPGISDLDLPGGTYSKLRVTFLNSFPIEGTLDHGGSAYYTTATTINDNSALLATTNIGLRAEGTIKNPNWGDLGDPVVQTFDITPFSVTAETDFQPTIKFSVDNSLQLWGPTPGMSVELSQDHYYFILDSPTVSIV